MFSLSSSFLIRFLTGLLVLSIFVSFFYSCKKDSKENENEDIVTLLGIGLYARSCVGQNTFPSSGNVGALTRLQISPTQTSSAINSYNTPHQVYLPQSGVSRKNILSVFYPGTGSSPCEIGAILQQGATRGYHIIGLSYPNNEAVNSVCNQGDAKSDAGCFENLRREVITGADVSPYVSVDASNSIEGRLLSLLQYLVQTRPGEGWEQFVTGNNINWSLVYVGGHSQGSGHAAFHGKIRAVARVSIYSGVSDYSLQFATIPTWMGGGTNGSCGFVLRSNS